MGDKAFSSGVPTVEYNMADSSFLFHRQAGQDRQ
jgi:hypothetical protein